MVYTTLYTMVYYVLYYAIVQICSVLYFETEINTLTVELVQ